MINHKLFERIFLGFIVLVALGLVGIYISNANTPFSGEGKVNIGGRSLYLKSEGAGTPTVIFESDMGGSSMNWSLIAQEVKEQARVITYDRAGMRQSDKGPQPRTSEQKAVELHRLLKKARIKPPYIFVAEKYGAFNARVFAAKYPKEVAGIIMVNPIGENSLAAIEKHLTKEQFEEIKASMKEQIDQIGKSSADGSYDDLMISMQQAAGSVEGLRDIPLTVILPTIVLEDDYMKAFMTEQKKLSELSNRGKLIVLDKIHIDINNIKDTIIEEVTELVNQIEHN